jgi:hypothetical protein
MAEEDRRRAWARVGDHIFFTIGGGTDWHENGFPQCKVDATVPDIDDGKAVLRRFTLGGDGLLRKIEVLDPKGQVLEVFEWTDLRKNPADWPPGLFEKF